MIGPSASSLKEAGELLRGLSSARQTYTLYDEGHPLREEVVRNLLARARRLLEDMEAPVLFVTRHGFYLGPALMSRESLALFRLIEAFEQAGIEAVELLPTVSEKDLHTLIEMLLGRRRLEAEFDGMALNRVRPSETAETGGEGSAMRRGYAAGLELLRLQAARVAAGRPADLEGTRRLIEELSDLVDRDPAQALLLTAVKSYDEYTYYHMMNVCLLSLAFGQAIGLPRDQIVELGMGALLHDVGKVSVPREILEHVGALSDEQWRVVQRHPVEGAGFVLGTTQGLVHPATAVILEHHSGYDLSGYPTLTGRSRPALGARLVAIADCFDAVTSKRAYRKAADRREALGILQAASGTGFDPWMVRAFVRLLGLFPVGSLVRLDDGAVGVVVRNHPRLLSRPAVKLVLAADGSPCEPEERDLGALSPDGTHPVSIERSVDPREIGMDLSELISSGRLDPIAPEEEPSPGLVHDPSPGEPVPPGYPDAEGTPQRADEASGS